VPDLLTHAALGSMLGVASRRRVLIWLVVGSVLPDLASRLPGLGMALASRLLGFSVSYDLLQSVELGHVPSAVVVLCLLIALLLPAHMRSAVLLGLGCGSMVHLALDTAQRHLTGGYLVLYPLSMKRFELGLVDSEASLDLLPYTVGAAVVLLVVRWASRRRRRVAPPQSL
jgi:hypothetical protein